MAGADKLWFELGVRDEISGVLEKLMRNSEKLANKLTDDTVELKNVYRNIVDISNVYDKIYIAQKRISELKGTSITSEQKKGLKEMSKELEDIRKQFTAILKNPDRATQKGEASFEKMRLNFELMLKDTLRYVDNIEAKERAEALNAANESKRIEDLKSKYYDLQRYRKQLSDAIVGATPGTDLTEATKLINSISGKMSAVKRAQTNGGAMPSSVTGADYDEFLRKVKVQVNSLTTATSDYNAKLETNRQLQAQLIKLKADATSQQTIAGIRKQTTEYNALGRKIQEITNLINELKNDEAGIKMGLTPNYGKERVSGQLDAIQRRYNEALAIGRQREIDDANAKNKKTAAANKAREAIGMLAHANEGLISSYNRVAEAGSQANRITIQLQNQIGAYAGLYGLERILKSIVTIGGQFEVQHVALQNILGDVQEANILFGQLKELAIESPKTFMELTSYAKQLSAYQIPANELFDTTKRLADMSSGLGVDMNRLILAYGQVRSAAVLRGQELRQFTEAGIPMVQALADKFTQLNGKLTTTADVFKLISARAVPFEMVKEVLWDMTSQGGQFFNMQEELANTLYGKWQKLQDSWQIMLGSIAEDSNPFGWMLKNILDLTVAITNNLDNFVVLLSSLGAARGLKMLAGGLLDTRLRRTGEMAINNMLLAKKAEANRLDRERIMYGRELNAVEKELIRTKTILNSREQALLVQSGEISMKKAQQLIQEGKLSKWAAYRLALEQGITKEKIRQMATYNNWSALGNVGAETTVLGKAGKLFGIGAKGLLGFFGGWIGAAFTAIGALTSIYGLIKESDERLNDMANSISGSAEQNANQLANTLKNVANSSDEPFKKVEALEEALLGMGNAGKQIVEESRGFDEMGKRLDSLTEKAKAYQQALDAMGTPVGKAAIKEALSESDLNDEMEEYEDLQNAEYKRMLALERYSTTKYQQMIDALKAKHKELNDELNGKDLFENLRILMTGNYANEAVGYFAGGTPWRDALTDYAKAVEESEEHLNNIKNNIIPGAMNNLKALARKAGVDTNKAFEDLTEAEKTKLRAIATGFANGLEHGSQDAKDKLAAEFAKGFYAQLFLTPVINTNELTGLPLMLDEWQKGKGFGLWSKNDLKEANSDFIAFSKKQSQRKVDLEKKLKNYDTQLTGGVLDPDLIPTIKGQREALQTELNQLNASLKEGQWVFDKTLTKGNKKGDQKDTELEIVKNRVNLYKKFYAELENARKIYGQQGGLDFLKANGFDTVFGWNLSDVTNYRKSIDELVGKLAQTTEQRRKFVNQTDADKVVEKRKAETDAIKEYVNELQKMLSIMSENYQTYRKWLNLTGDAGLAARAAGVTQNTTYADYLKEKMQEALAAKPQGTMTADDVFGLDHKEVIDTFGKDSSFFAIWEEWRKHQNLLKKEQWSLYEEAIRNAKDYDDKIEDVNRSLEKQIQDLRELGVGEDLVKSVTQNAQDKVSELQWEKFKKENDWGRVFGDLDNMSLKTLKKMVDAMNQFRKETRLSEKESRAWQKAMKDITDKATVLDPIYTMTQAIKDYKAAVGSQKVAKEQLRIANMPYAERHRNGIDESGVLSIEEAEKRVQKAADDVSEAFNQLKKAAVAIGNTFKSLGSSLSSLGSSFGGGFGDILGGFGSMFSSLGSGISAIQNFNANGKGLTGLINKVSTVMSVVSAMVDMNKALASILPSTESIYEEKAAEQQHINQLREAVDAYRVAVARARAEEEGWIADDPLKELQDAYKIHGDIATQYFNKLYEAQEAYIDSSAGIEKAVIPLLTAVGAVATVFTAGTGAFAIAGLWSAIASTIGSATIGAIVGGAIAAGAGYAIGQAAQAAIDAISYDNGQTDARSNMKVQTRHKTWFRSEKTQNLEEWAKENLGVDLFDKNGLINLEAAQAVLDSGATLVGETRETLEKLMELREQYDEWEKSIKDYISGSFGNLADNMTDAIWDWLDSGKNALDSFKDYASDTFKKVAQDAVKTFIKTAVLDQFEEQLVSLYKAYSMKDSKTGQRFINEQQLMLGVSAIAGDIATSFESALPVAEELAKTIADAFGYYGYDIVGNNNTSSASNSIKSISETTGDILASYVNGIRADVSANRAMHAQYYPQFLDAMNRNNVLADAQVQQLKALVDYARQNVGLVQRIYDILHGVAPDGTKIQVK